MKGSMIPLMVIVKIGWLSRRLDLYKLGFKRSMNVEMIIVETQGILSEQLNSSFINVNYQEKEKKKSLMFH